MMHGQNEHFFEQENGFTLIEVLIAMAIIAMGILPLFILQTSAIRANSTASRITEASTVTLDQVEEMLSWRRNDPRLRTQLSGTDTINGHSVSWTGERIMDPVITDMQVGVLMKVTISWKNGAGKTKTMKMNIKRPV